MTRRKHDAKGWKGYYDAHRKKVKPSPLVRRALRSRRAKVPRVAIDIGCGTGNDSVFLLKHGYQVLAIDAQRQALMHLRKVSPRKLRPALTTRIARFENLRRRDLCSASLINAAYSMFFCSPSAFGRFWRNLAHALVPGGVFCGQFLGLRDTWARRPGMTGLSKRALKKLFSDFEIIELSELDERGGTATGRAKHWHVYTVIARKKLPAKHESPIS